MKKDYLKPEQHISVIEVQTDMLKASAPFEKDPTDDFGSKDREDFGGESDSEWGALW